MKKIYVPIAIVVMSMLNGCSTSVFNPIGEDNFDCNRKSGTNPDWCHSVKSAIKSTDGNIPETDFDKTFSMEQFYREQGYVRGKSGDNPSQTSERGLLPHQVMRSAPVQGAPVREAPVVMQIYIKPFVNDDDVLVQGQTVYKEVVPSKWKGYAAVDKNKDSKAYPHYAESSGMSAPMQQQTRSTRANSEFVQPGQSSASQSANSSAGNDDLEMPQ